jgi:hypothetical protein
MAGADGLSWGHDMVGLATAGSHRMRQEAIVAALVRRVSSGVASLFTRTRARLAHVRLFTPSPAARVSRRPGSAGAVVRVSRVTPRHRTSGRIHHGFTPFPSAATRSPVVTTSTWSIARTVRPFRRSLRRPGSAGLPGTAPTLSCVRPAIGLESRSRWRGGTSDETRDTHQLDVAGNPRATSRTTSR